MPSVACTLAFEMFSPKTRDGVDDAFPRMRTQANDIGYSSRIRRWLIRSSTLCTSPRRNRGLAQARKHNAGAGGVRLATDQRCMFVSRLGPETSLMPCSAVAPCRYRYHMNEYFFIQRLHSPRGMPNSASRFTKEQCIPYKLVCRPMTCPLCRRNC